MLSNQIDISTLKVGDKVLVVHQHGAGYDRNSFTTAREALVTRITPKKTKFDAALIAAPHTKFSFDRGGLSSSNDVCAEKFSADRLAEHEKSARKGRAVQAIIRSATEINHEKYKLSGLSDEKILELRDCLVRASAIIKQTA